MIDKQQTQIRELTDKKNVVDLDYKKEYYNLQKENYELKKKIETRRLKNLQNKV